MRAPKKAKKKLINDILARVTTSVDEPHEGYFKKRLKSLSRSELISLSRKKFMIFD